MSRQLPLSIVLSSAHDGTGGTLRHLNRISPRAIGLGRRRGRGRGSDLSTSRLTQVHVSPRQRQTSTYHTMSRLRNGPLSQVAFLG
jgi:hypothetical protein